MTDNLVNETQRKLEEKEQETTPGSEEEKVSAQEQMKRVQDNDVEEHAEASIPEASEVKDSVDTADEVRSIDETNASKTFVSDTVADKGAENQSSGEVDFGAMLMEYEHEQSAFRKGKIVSGRVVGFTEKAMMVDFGHKSEGIVDIAEVTTPDGGLKLKEGDEIEVVIRYIDSSDNPPILSYLDALRRRAWTEIISAYRSKRPVQCRVVQRVKGGLKVDIKGVEAFLPASLVDSHPTEISKFVGQDIEVKIVKCNRKKNNVVVSRKAITDEIIKKQKDALFSQIGEGYLVEGTVKSVLDYGAFVDIGGIDGLLHVTEMSWGKVEHPSKLFSVGDKIQVKILSINRKKEKISLSYRQLLPDPWDIVPEKYPVGSIAKGKVVSIVDYGAFVELEAGVEGLVHVSEMTWSKRPRHPKKMVSIGQEVEVKVMEVEPKKRRLSLSMKSLIPNPWNFVEEKYPVGTVVKGVVRSLTNFGAFVEVEEGVDGFVHVSEITWKKIKHPKEVLKKKKKVEAKVLRIDHQKKRLSLSIKALQPSPWDLFIQNHRPGDIVRGKISRFTNFGVFVQLAEDLEGMCHISELSEEKVDSPEKVVKIGDELDFKILRIEPATQKIGLSHRAVKSSVEEKESGRKVYVGTEVKGALTSLGELLITKLGSGAKNLIPIEQEQKKTPEEKTSEEDTEASDEKTSGMTEAINQAKVEEVRSTEESLKEGDELQGETQPLEQQGLEEGEVGEKIFIEEVAQEKLEVEKSEGIGMGEEKGEAEISLAEDELAKNEDKSVEEENRENLQGEESKSSVILEENLQQTEQEKKDFQEAEQIEEESIKESPTEQTNVSEQETPEEVDSKKDSAEVS